MMNLLVLVQDAQNHPEPRENMARSPPPTTASDSLLGVRGTGLALWFKSQLQFVHSPQLTSGRESSLATSLPLAISLGDNHLPLGQFE